MSSKLKILFDWHFFNALNSLKNGPNNCHPIQLSINTVHAMYVDFKTLVEENKMSSKLLMGKRTPIAYDTRQSMYFRTVSS